MTTAFNDSESIAAATSPVAASGMSVAASSITRSRASGISRAHASPLPTGKNGSRLPCTTSARRGREQRKARLATRAGSAYQQNQRRRRVAEVLDTECDAAYVDRFHPRLPSCCVP